jgi:hypothetical protein
MNAEAMGQLPQCGTRPVGLLEFVYFGLRKPVLNLLAGSTIDLFGLFWDNF